MSTQDEQTALSAFARATQGRILETQSDLTPKDRALPEMVTWCRQQTDAIAVLQNGTILCNNPLSRVVQNCKVVLRHKGFIPGDVMAASVHLIRILLDNAEVAIDITPTPTQTMSNQQQRLRLLVREAVQLGATDIHLEVRDSVAYIRFRKHGELFLHAEWRTKLAREVAAVAFNKETDHAISHFNPLIPQNASMPIDVDGRTIRLRLASLPTHAGFDVVMRVLASEEDTPPKLETLGYSPDQIRLLERAIQMPHGAVIVSGPTGSGKTTTLASCMSCIETDRKVYTVEDPIEKIIPRASQIPVNTEMEDRSFASMARTILRMDPDVITFGEMRDEDTASVMVRAAVTGHLVFSTLHTNTAPDIITRLMDLKVSQSLLSSPNLLICLICQRLVPLLCPHCALPIGDAPLPDALRTRLYTALASYWPTLRVRHPNGCINCQGLGIHRRTVIAEIIWMDEESRTFVQRHDLLGWQRYLRANGWRNFGDRLLEKVFTGQCDPLDAERLIGHIQARAHHKAFSYKEVVG